MSAPPLERGRPESRARHKVPRLARPWLRRTKRMKQRFGRIYLVCAAGRSGEELLADIAARMNNPPDKELEIAVEEQRKIITLRLTSLIGMQAS